MAYQNFSGSWLPDSAPANSWISGTSAAEWLNGTSLNDSFNTGGGADTIAGGLGDDYYWLAGPAQKIAEYAGQGVDTANIWSSYVLPANVENLIIQNTNTYGAGNDSANIIQGGDGPQYLYGGRGEDVLVGGGGNDTFVIKTGEGNKVVQDFQAGADKIRLLGGPTDFAALKAGMVQQGSDTIVNDNGTMIALRGVQTWQLQASDFQLPLNYSSLGSMTFDDEFNNLSLGAGGTWQTSFGDGLAGHTLVRNNEAEIYVDPSFAGSGSQALGINPFSVSNGIATITADRATGAQQSQLWGYQYTSGILFSNYTQLYGYFEMKAELPKGQGLWPAFWLATGANEIDVLEGLGSDTKVPYNAIHSPQVPSLGVANYLPDDGGYHTYGTLWSPSDIVFYVDGNEVWRTATPSDMNQPMHIIANLALGGSWAGLPDGTTPFPAHMNIDYIRAYNLPGNGSSGISPPPVSPPPVSPPPVSPPPVSPPPVTSPASPPPPSGGGSVITSHGYGDSLVGTSGADTLISNQGGETMVGGAGADTFVFKTTPWTPSHITDFAPGVDHLDLSGLYLGGYNGADPVADGYVSFVSDGAGGTAVLVDPDGRASGHQWGDYVVDLEHVAPTSLTAANALGASGGSGGASPPPPPASGGAVLTSAYAGDHLVGGAGSDTLNASRGADQLTGGAGADHFVFAAEPWAPAHITDFQHGQDVVDLKGLFAATGYWGSDPVADHYLTLISDGNGGTAVLFDRDGSGSGQQWGDYIIDLEHVSPSSLTSADWVIR
ncbi:family 16 glycosylhydrolase [Phenylobacterium soli]|uniref:1,3-beta-glucanase n=1 Tax=Phenylobacterium soli TaxID=2170551 RepID=A0A328AJK9_9CAUL|nr:family 16 glycosylhydrolase [Phenylobacterium soli]RAK55133.1 1,3-beta-glucanase [Phenylobacterium soli]